MHAQADFTLYPCHPKYIMIRKAKTGMINAFSIPDSESKPVRGGSTAPPTMAIITKPEPSFTCSPKFLIDKAKIVGNMMDIKK